MAHRVRGISAQSEASGSGSEGGARRGLKSKPGGTFDGGQGGGDDFHGVVIEGFGSKLLTNTGLGGDGRESVHSGLPACAYPWDPGPVSGAILGLGTATPSVTLPQDVIAQWLACALEAQPDAPEDFGRIVRRMASRSGVSSRATVLPDYATLDPERFAFFPKSWALDPFPGTQARMAIYEEEALKLAAQAAQKALEDADVAPSRIEHVVFVTCTGFFAPGPDIRLIKQLGLPANVRRTQIGFMGCYAGVTALRLARELAAAEEGAHILVVSVELCSLHFQKEARLETLVPNLLFGDGAAAAVIGPDRNGAPRITTTASEVAPDTREAMTWRMGDHGFVMTLRATVPQALQDRIRPFAERLAPHNEVGGWAVHPGGRRITEAAAEALQLEPEDLASSNGVLAEHGNMSSASIFFVLQRALRKGAGPLLALAFGPGLTLEGLRIDR